MRKHAFDVLTGTQHKVSALALAAAILLFGATTAAAQEKPDAACKSSSCTTTGPMHTCDPCYGLRSCGCYGYKPCRCYPPLPGPCMDPYEGDFPCQRGPYINPPRPVTEQAYPNQLPGDYDTRLRSSGPNQYPPQ